MAQEVLANRCMENAQPQKPADRRPVTGEQPGYPEQLPKAKLGHSVQGSPQPRPQRLWVPVTVGLFILALIVYGVMVVFYP